jgi:hypothetical protein
MRRWRHLAAASDLMGMGVGEIKDGLLIADDLSEA